MMNQLLSYDLAYALAWTLVHSVWQITIVALGVAGILTLAKKSSAQTRYLISFSSLGIIFLSSLVTFAIYYQSGEETTLSVVSGLTGEFISHPQASVVGLLGLVNKYLFVIVYAWFIGSFLFLLKLVGGYSYIKNIVAKASNENDQLVKKLNKLKLKFKIKRDIALKASAAITTPMVVGFIKPVILFPIGLVNQLSGEEVAAILAHELAHIKRHDFIFNLMQSVMEAIYYFHPGMWYLSSSITKERENCCDDLAIQYTTNRISYAKTLIKLQEMKLKGLEPALAMAGKNGNFGNRIKRILDVPVQSSQLKEKVFALLLLCLTFVGFAHDNQQNEEINLEDIDVYIIDDCPQDITDIKHYVDTIPERNNFHVRRSSKDKDLELKMEDGVISELKINGEIIPETDYSEVEDVIIELTPDGKKEMITVFPDCGEGFGNIYYLNKDKQALNLDSILQDVTAKMKTFENFEESRFDFHIDKFDDAFIDSLKDEISSIQKSVFKFSHPSNLDSLFVLQFDKESKTKNHPFQFDQKDWLIDTLERAFDLSERFRTASIDSGSKNVYDVISHSLLEDAFISDDRVSKVELSGKHLKIDGEKQPSNIHRKYKKIFESSTGLELNKNTKIEIEVDPAEIKKSNPFRLYQWTS